VLIIRNNKSISESISQFMTEYRWCCRAFNIYRHSHWENALLFSKSPCDDGMLTKTTAIDVCDFIY